MIISDHNGQIFKDLYRYHLRHPGVVSPGVRRCFDREIVTPRQVEAARRHCKAAICPGFGYSPQPSQGTIPTTIVKRSPGIRILYIGSKLLRSIGAGQCECVSYRVEGGRIVISKTEGG